MNCRRLRKGGRRCAAPGIGGHAASAAPIASGTERRRAKPKAAGSTPAGWSIHNQGVGEPGRPCLPWKQETGGSNPPALTKPRRRGMRPLREPSFQDRLTAGRDALNVVMQVRILLLDPAWCGCSSCGTDAFPQRYYFEDRGFETRTASNVRNQGAAGMNLAFLRRSYEKSPAPARGAFSMWTGVRADEGPRYRT